MPIHMHTHANRCICMYTCAHIYAHIHTFICMHTYMPIHICIYHIHAKSWISDICLHTHIYVCMHSYTHAWIYLHTYIIPQVHTYAYTFKQAHILTHMHAHVRTDAFMVCRCPFNFLSWKLNTQSHMLMVLKSRTCGKPRALKWLISHVLVHDGRGCYKEKAFWNIWSLITWYPLSRLRSSKTLTCCQINVSAHGLLTSRTAGLANFCSL